MDVTRAVKYSLVIALSLAGLAAVSQTADSFWNAQMDILTPLPSPVMMRAYIPPARKAIIVDLDGLSHTTADNVRLTRRDRSREILTPVEKNRKHIQVYVYPPQSLADRSAVRTTNLNISERAIRPEPAGESVAEAVTPAVLPSHETGAEPARAVTYGDEFLTPSDRELTASIRKALMSDDALFITALNIRILAVDGEVTLRGFVNSDREKTLIGKKARQIAGRRKVHNRLDILVRH